MSSKFSHEFYAYGEKQRLLEIFQILTERVVLEQPENPVEFLHQILINRAVFYIPKVYVLGPSTVDRKLASASLASKLRLLHLNRESLNEMAQQDEKTASDTENDDSATAKLVHRRVSAADCTRSGWLLEGYPTTRKQAFELRTAGVFPTHIVVIDDPNLTNRLYMDGYSSESSSLTEQELKETHDFFSHVHLILNLHSKTYKKRFSVSTDSDDFNLKVLEFVKIKPKVKFTPRVLLLGPYGSGRRTMAKKLTEKYKLLEVDMQYELRKSVMNTGDVNDEISDILRSSKAVPDEMLARIVAERLMQDDCIDAGWVMYNFPDTATQAEFLVEKLVGFQLNRVIFLDASLQTCLHRCIHRRIDPTTGETHHLLDNPPPPTTSSTRLLSLAHDSSESVTAEHSLYAENRDHLQAYFCRRMGYEDVVTCVQADRQVEEVWEDVWGALLRGAKMRIPEEDV